jgi:hypothetical protein
MREDNRNARDRADRGRPKRARCARCKSCGYRETCAVDLKRDPNNPVWETYCPNTGAFIALAEARRAHDTIRSLYKSSG